MANCTAINGQLSKTQSIIGFASHLQQTLVKQSASPQNFPELSIYFQALPLSQDEVSPEERIQLNKQGVALWNTCAKIKRADGESEHKQNAARARAFAYLLLESAVRHGRKYLADQLKLFKNALRAARDCLDSGVLDLAAKILEKAAGQQETLNINDAFELPCDAQELSRCFGEYLLLRLTLAWRQDRTDLAEHFFTKIATPKFPNDSSSLEKLIDLLFEIGKEKLETNHYKVASKWLKRASCLLHEHETQLSSPDIGDLTLSVLHTYVRSLLALETPEAENEAHRVVEILRRTHGHKLAVMLLQIEILSRDASPSPEAFSAQLSTIAQSVHLIDSNHKMVLHYIHHLRGLSPEHACSILVQFVVQRLAPHGNVEWMESAVITLIWITTNKPDDSALPEPERLNTWLTDIYQAWDQSLSSEATHGAFILIWKKLEAPLAGGINESAICWCQVALHRIFEKAGEHNVGKVKRKLATCQLDVARPEAALDTLSKMSSSAKSHRLSRYLSYTIAIRLGDEQMAQQTLNLLASIPDESNRLLFACVAETVRFGSMRQGARILQRVLDKYHYVAPPEIDSCALLRCTARLLISVLEEEVQVDEEMLSRLCAIFKAAAEHSVKCDFENNSRGVEWSLEDCEWFAKNGYNFALKNMKEWPTKYVIDLLQYVSQIRYSDDNAYGSEDAADRDVSHRSSIFYVQAVLYTAQARKVSSTWSLEDLPKSSYKHRSPPDSFRYRQILYQNAFDQFTLFNKTISGPQQGEPKTNEHIQSRQIKLLPLAFEALLHLTEPSDEFIHERSVVDQLSLLQIVEQANRLSAPTSTYGLFADMVLSASAASDADDGPTRPLLSLSTTVPMLRCIIAGVREAPNYDLSQASRWIRCVVHFILAPEPRQSSSVVTPNFKLLDEIISQALNLARSVHSHSSGSEKTRYPAEELEWLASTVFNLAVDLYIATGEDQADNQSRRADSEGCAKHWAWRAVEVADMLSQDDSTTGEGNENQKRSSYGDRGMLASILRGKMSRLGWSI